ncbi:MAG: hypothetical protein WC325_04940 [Candidatus Bathyarchaeia archaeon]
MQALTMFSARKTYMHLEKSGYEGIFGWWIHFHHQIPRTNPGFALDTTSKTASKGVL